MSKPDNNSSRPSAPKVVIIDSDASESQSSQAVATPEVAVAPQVEVAPPKVEVAPQVEVAPPKVETAPQVETAPPVETAAKVEALPPAADADLPLGKKQLKKSIAAPKSNGTPRVDSAKPIGEPKTEMPLGKKQSEKNFAAENTKTVEDREKNRFRFTDLPLSKEVQQAVAAAGYEFPTAIQEQIIPHVLEGRDVMAQSQTGSGKTAAFALPILTQIDTTTQKPHVLVLAPTRELASQVARAFETYASKMPKLSVVAIYGGQDYEIQFRKLRRGVQVVVGTPGRVIDHVNRGTLDLSQVKTLVLDEADEMLNMGFVEDVKFVLDKMPEERQVTLFSATFNSEIQKIAKRYLTDPVQIKIQKKNVTADSIRQRAMLVSNREKMDLLVQMLEVEETDGVLVFTRTRESTVFVADELNRAGLSVAALNGDMPQRAREKTIERLKSNKLNIVVATDVAARGLDVQRISHVFNYDFPEGSESYIHRIGRTGRAGRKGEAIIFLTHGQRGKLRMVERATGRAIEVVDRPTAQSLNAMRVTKLRGSITKTIADEDLARFEKLINEHVAETGENPVAVAAALAHLGQRGAEFFSTDRPKRKFEREDRDRGDRGDRGRGGRRRGHEGPEEGMVRYRIEVGRRHSVKPGNIVGAISNEAGIEGKHIGSIQIYDFHSTVDLPDGMPEDVKDLLDTTRVSGQQLKIRKATAKDSVAQSRGRNPRGRSFGGAGGSGGRRGGGGGDFRKGKPGKRKFSRDRNFKKRK